jgi:cytochrome oxidase assembly protein ShyY1
LGIEKNVADQLYLRMSAESTKVTSYPAQMAKPKLDEGNHLSYAIQWIVFGLMAFAALIWAIQQERLALRAATDPNFVRKARKKIGDEDKAYEDAL